MPDTSTDADPRPKAPRRPASDECCRGACQPCIFDLYEEELERYRKELHAWEERHPEAHRSG